MTMKRILLTAVAVIFGAAAVVLVLAASKPDTLQVQRSVAINAPAEKIFPLLDDFRQWPQWSPYEHRDPNMKRTFGATSKGRGATYAWDGNSDIGAGHMAITDSAPPSALAIALEFERPIRTSNAVKFTLAPQGNATQVTWQMTAAMPFISRVFQVVFDIGKMIGDDMEAGLAKLKSAAEKG